MGHQAWTAADVDYITIYLSYGSSTVSSIHAWSNDGLHDDVNDDGIVGQVVVRGGIGELDDPSIIKMIAAYNDTTRNVPVYFQNREFAESFAHFAIESPTNPGLREPKPWMLNKSLFFNQIPASQPTAPTPPTGTIALGFQQFIMNLHTDYVGTPPLPTDINYTGNGTYDNLTSGGVTWYKDPADIPASTTTNIARWQITGQAELINNQWEQTDWTLIETAFAANAIYYRTALSSDGHNPRLTTDTYGQYRVSGGGFTPRLPLSGRADPLPVGSNQYLASPTVTSREFGTVHFLYNPQRTLRVYLARLRGLTDQRVIMDGYVDIPMEHLRPVASTTGPIVTNQSVRITVTKDGITGFTTSTLNVSDGFDANNKINHIIQLKFVAGSTNTVGSIKVWFPNLWVTYGISARVL